MRLKKTLLWITAVVFFVSAISWNPSVVYSQEFDDFGEEIEEGSESEKPKSKIPKLRSPLAESFLRTDPKTAEDNFAFLETLIDLKEEKAAWYYLSRLGDTPLEGEAALKFVETVGTSRILKFTGHKDFPEEKKEWFKATSRNAFAHLNSDGNLDVITNDVLSDNHEVRKSAIRRVQASGHRIVFPLLKKVQDLIVDKDSESLSKLRSPIYKSSKKWNQAISDVATTSERFLPAAVFASLNRPTNAVSDALLLAFGKEAGKSEINLVSGLYRSWVNRFEQDYGFRPDSQSALAWVKYHRTRAQKIYHQYLDGKISRSLIGEYWKVNPETLFLEQKDVSTFYLAAKNLQFWTLIESKLAAEENKERTRLEHISAVVRAEKIRVGFDRLLSEQAEKAISDFKEESSGVLHLLNQAVEKKDWIVALGTLQWLERHPQEISLKMVGKKNSAIVRCFNSPDPRVRAKAVLTALKSSQEGRFAGSSDLNRAITKVLSAPEAVQAIVVTTHQEDGDALTSAVRTDGWKVLQISPTKIIPTIQNNRLVFAIITDALGTRRFIPTLDRIRSTPSGKTLPIFLCVRPENEEKARSMFRVDRFDPLTKIIPLERAEVDLPKLISSAVSQVGHTPIPQIAAQADRYLVLQSLSEWANDPKKNVNLDFQLLGNSVREIAFLPEVGVFASDLLAKHGNAKSQTALLDSASSFQTQPKVRTAAAKAFRESVKRFGLLLTAGQLKAQYKRQNNSGTEDEYSQQIHNSLLDTIEARHKKVKFDDLAPVPDPEN